VDAFSADGETVTVKTTASFGLFGSAGLTAGAVTNALTVQPSRSHESGEAWAMGKPSDTSVWILQSSDGLEDGVDLATQIERLLAVLEPVTSKIWALIELGHWAKWSCYVGLAAGEYAAELERPILTRMLLLPGELWLEVGD
jgi:hypothetical protein